MTRLRTGVAISVILDQSVGAAPQIVELAGLKIGAREFASLIAGTNTYVGNRLALSGNQGSATADGTAREAMESIDRNTILCTCFRAATAVRVSGVASSGINGGGPNR